MAIVFVVVAYAPYAAVQLPQVNSYIPTVFAVRFVTDLVAAVLLSGDASGARFRVMLPIGTAHPTALAACGREGDPLPTVR